MKGKPHMTLAEMAARSSTIAGRLICSKCGCGDFRTYKTIQGQVQTFRYKICRHCNRKMCTTQEPEKAVRDIETDDVVDADGIDGEMSSESI